MTGDPTRLLLFHGAIIVALGLVAGFPFWLAIIGNREATRIRAWRVAHTTVLMDGLLLWVVASLEPHVNLSVAFWTMAVLALVVSAYGFVFALIVGAWAGERGLKPVPAGVNSLFFVGHAVGATGAIVGVGLLLCGFLP